MLTFHDPAGFWALPQVGLVPGMVDEEELYENRESLILP